MELLLRTSAFAALLLAIVVLNPAVAAGQYAGTPGPATTRPATVEPVRVADDENIELAPVDDKADTPRSWSWLGWPTMTLSMVLGSFWAIRRFRTSLLEARLAKISSGGEQRPLDAIPIAQSSSGGLPSGALLLVLATSMSFSLAALYDYPSQIDGLHPWIDIVPWVWFFGGPFLVGLLSESRGVGAIPILGYVLGLLLWHSTPGESMDALFYDIGWLGFLLGLVAFWVLSLYLIFRVGRALRGHFV